MVVGITKIFTGCEGMTMTEKSTESSTPVQDVVMRRFWLFGGDFYYAAGGMHDFRGSFDTVEDAMKYVLVNPMRRTHPQYGPAEWWHVFDSDSKSIAAQSMQQAFGSEDFPDLSA